MSVFEQLGALREEQGLELEALADELRVAPELLIALEQGRVHDFADDQAADDVGRAYALRLGMRADDVVDAIQLARSARRPVSLKAVRAVAAVAVVVLLGLIGWQVMELADDGRHDVVVGEGDADEDQRVRLTVLLGGSYKIVVDGKTVLDRRLPPGERVEVAGMRRVEVHIPAAKSARIEYNGERVQPQGRQDVPRKLVFIDDANGD